MPINIKLQDNILNKQCNLNLTLFCAYNYRYNSFKSHHSLSTTNVEVKKEIANHYHKNVEVYNYVLHASNIEECKFNSTSNSWIRISH